MPKTWTDCDILALANTYQKACVLAAAVDLDLFAAFANKAGGSGGFSVEEATARLHADLRGMTILLDALTALELLEKDNEESLYTVPESVALLLGSDKPGNVRAMAQHQANCLRNWAQLGHVVKTGKPAERRESVRGAKSDHEAFIEAMDNVSAPMAPKIIKDLQPLRFKHVLDVGGATGTWALEFLRQNPDLTARATIFDLPEVIDQAKQRVAASGLAARVLLAKGDYLTHELPAGCDLAWVSAIIHSLGRLQCRELYQRCFQALVPGGQILIRDYLMDTSRTTPVGGALFAINMLVATAQGNTYSIPEITADLEAPGFKEVRLPRPDDTMHAVIGARKPS